MIKRILVTGKSGQLGQSIQKIQKHYPEFDFQFVGRDELDFSQPNEIKTATETLQFDAIINCAAYTAVDKAESEPELANAVNNLSVEALAKLAKEKNALLLHVSTDYVFDGCNYKPYQELDTVGAKNVYGETKQKGEQAILNSKASAFILRTSWVYSEFGNNFVKTMLRLGHEKDELNVIFDQVGTPTYASDLAKGLLQICQHINKQPGSHNGVAIYHFSNEGVCSWYDFAKTIFEIEGINCKLSPIETKDYPTPAKRPYYGILNKAKFKTEFNTSIPHWKDSLHVCLTEIENNNGK